VNRKSVLVEADHSNSSSHGSRLTHHTSSFPALDALLFFFFINLALQPLVEPDFGWHLRTGLDLLSHGWRMPLTDPYSHTVPEWPWVEHAWLTDGIVALIYSGLGSAGGSGVILLFAAVITGAFVLSAATARASRTARSLSIAVVAWIALPFLGARIQMVTLLGLACVLWLWNRFRQGRVKTLWLFPPLFLLWANLHGGFTAGLFTLGLLLAVTVLMRIVADRRFVGSARVDEPILTWTQIGHMAAIFGISLLVTLINPYGWRLYAEIVQSLGDRFMLDTLQEWQPVSLLHRAGRIYVAYLIGLASLMLCFYRRIEPTRWAVLGIFLALSLRHWRNVPFFLLVSIPLAADLIQLAVAWMAERVSIIRRHSAEWLFGVLVALALGMVWLGADHLERVIISGLQPERFFAATEYPMEAVQWIREHRRELGTKLYNDYGLGGFLLWWLPGEKIFIDGRMPAWRIGDRWIFYDYVALTSWDPPALGVLAKYGVDWALTATDGPLDRSLRGMHGWQIRYEDEKVRIFVKASGDQ
jgi:hypothetical protein